MEAKNGGGGEFAKSTLVKSDTVILCNLLLAVY